jgi:hypothetical protein
MKKAIGRLRATALSPLSPNIRSGEVMARKRAEAPYMSYSVCTKVRNDKMEISRIQNRN